MKLELSSLMQAVVRNVMPRMRGITVMTVFRVLAIGRRSSGCTSGSWMRRKRRAGRCWMLCWRWRGRCRATTRASCPASTPVILFLPSPPSFLLSLEARGHRALLFRCPQRFAAAAPQPAPNLSPATRSAWRLHAGHAQTACFEGLTPQLPRPMSAHQEEMAGMAH